MTDEQKTEGETEPTVTPIFEGRVCAAGGPHVPWRLGEWNLIVLRQPGLRVAIEICCRCGVLYVEDVSEDGN